ncbi:putative baseplate assembly protein [Streptomyces sp. WMMB 322]|uniref:putative baseplate assembly protein n=1 Tax=Streptomyces sp. WMMB 322 TaxID=1286821 RepID=UPI0006E44B49|nr:putative baseplate assembly protein [Streptomyces sp. WMMB 322]SCK08641.1 putative baseplate assembly protein [Streptomyces sp. WMMB 322]
MNTTSHNTSPCAGSSPGPGPGPASDCGCGCGGHDENRAPAALHNPPGRTALELRTGTHASFLAAMLDRLASPAYPALRGLTARSTDDPAVALLDAWAVLGDLLTFHSERIADEGYLRTADEHGSLAMLARLVGHRPRPGVAAGTYLAYTVDRDPRADGNAEVLIPRGSRSHSVPAATSDEAQTYETDEDLAARAEWNRLKVRRRRPSLIVPGDLKKRSEIFVAGTDVPLRKGDDLLFVFGGGKPALLSVAGTRIDRDDDVTAIRLPDSAPPSLKELVELLRSWITVPEPEEPGAADAENAADAEDSGKAESAENGADGAEKTGTAENADDAQNAEDARNDGGEVEAAAETPSASRPAPNPRPVSRLIEDFDEQVLAPLREDLEHLVNAREFVHRLAQPRERLAEAQALAAPYEEPAAWFAELAAMLGELAERAAELGSVGEPAPSSPAPGGGTSALRVLDAVLPAFRSSGRISPPAGRSGAGHGRGLGAGPAPVLAAGLLGALEPATGRELYGAWQRAKPAGAAAPPVPDALRELLAMGVTAAPFGSTAPLKPVQDTTGRVVQTTDWPLSGAELTGIRIEFDPAGKVPQRAEFGYARYDLSRQRTEALPADTSFTLGPGRVELHSRTGQDHGLSWLNRRPETSQEPGVTVRLHPGLPERTVFISRPGEEGAVQVAVHNGETAGWLLKPGEEQRARQGDIEITARYTTRSEPASVEVVLATVPDPEGRSILRLDGVYENIEVGSRVVVSRPRKGADGGVPGDKDLAFVSTRVMAARTASYADYGITGRGTELTLADPWLDERDVLLSHIRDTTVYAAGTELRLADEPLDDDVHGNEIVLDRLYEGIRPGRTIAVSGERTDVPHTSGVHATEVAVVARAEQYLDPRLPGDHVHTVLTLTGDLEHRYRRETVVVQGNVVSATHGESREEAIGSGDAGRTHQTFTLWQAPLTWLPDAGPLGARPTLEIRVDGLLWHPVDSLAGRGPTERVYVTGTAGDGRTTVTFGDGVHGARLPSGHENVRARYRFGTGAEANVAAGRITQPVTRPLGVTGVTNPVPATGGADPDGPAHAAASRRPGRLPAGRRRIPLAVSALDRLVSAQDYEDFARSRAGIGRAVAREVTDGRRRLLHLTVAGDDDIPLEPHSRTLRALRTALAQYGDGRLPVRVGTRELVVLVVAAKVKVARDHSWQYVEPRLRQALQAELGYAGRDLAVPARPSDALAAAHTVPGVDWVDLDVFTGIPEGTPPQQIVDRLTRPGPPGTVPARPAGYDEQFHRVTAPEGETLSHIAGLRGISLEELLRLNPDITDTRPLPRGRSVCVFRGIRAAQFVLLPPNNADSLVLTEVEQ